MDKKYKIVFFAKRFLYFLLESYLYVKQAWLPFKVNSSWKRIIIFSLLFLTTHVYLNKFYAQKYKGGYCKRQKFHVKTKTIISVIFTPADELPRYRKRKQRRGKGKQRNLWSTFKNRQVNKLTLLDAVFAAMPAGFVHVYVRKIENCTSAP